MNKFFAIAGLMACSCLLAVSATPLELSGDEAESSFASFNPDNEQETEWLTDRTKIFSDFCLSSRDFVIGDIKSRSNGFAATMFNMLFSSAENIGMSAVEVSRDATDKLSTQIRDPNAKIAEPTNEVEQVIAEAQKKIQEEGESQPKSLLTGFIGVLAATKNAVTATVMNKVSDMKSNFGGSLLTGALQGVCNRIEAYENDIRNTFEQVKKQVVEAGNPGLEAIQFEDVECLTSRRLIRLDGICKFAIAAKNPAIKAISYKPIEKKAN